MDALAARRAAEAEAELDRMIAAFATARIPQALEAWATRKRGPGPQLSEEDRLRARDRTLAMLGSTFPGRVKVS